MDLAPQSTSTVEYRPISGAHGYAVGSDGSVWSCRHASGKRSWHRLRPKAGKRGHLRVALMIECQRVERSVHVIVAEAFIGPVPAGSVVRHYPSPDPENNRTGNLRIGTYADNSADMIAHGNSTRGERHSQAKLTESQVVKIRELSADGKSLADLSREFGVTKTMICAIVKRRNWKHV